jgi:hypothetical protein
MGGMGGMHHLLNLLTSPNLPVRMYALLTFCSVVQFATKHGKLSSIPVIPVSTTKPGASGPIPVGKDDIYVNDFEPRAKGRCTSKDDVEAEPSKDDAHTHTHTQTHTKETDIFDELDIPASNLAGIFLWIQRKLKALTKVRV